MMDENAANKIAVGKVLRENMHKRTVSCQWHYLHHAKKQSNRVTNTNDKKLFKEYSRASVEQAVTFNKYACICHALKMMGTQQQPRTVLLSVTPNTIHTGTNQKAQ